MKLFQRLLVAPAALGLMAPLAANADVSPVSSESDLSSEVSALECLNEYTIIYLTYFV